MKPRTEALEKRWLALSYFERLLLIGIVGVLIWLGIAQLASSLARDRDNERKRDIKTLQQAVNEYYALRGYYPVSLGGLKNLPADACQAPRSNSDCSTPDYNYKAFRRGVQPAVSKQTNCNNKKYLCASYIIYTDRMETVGNPYQLTPY